MSNFKGNYEYKAHIQKDGDRGIDEKGAIVFQVITGDGSIPVKDAKVTITRKLYNDIYFIRTLYTNEDGKTITIIVDAPPKNLSLSPEFVKPYYVYMADIEAEGYKPVNNKPIQVFEGVTTIQTVLLEPIGVSYN